MKTKRIKIALPTIENRVAAESVMNDVALIANNERKIKARRDAEILAINRKYEANLAGCATDLQTKTEMLRAWAESNPSEFPKGRKSIDFVSGILGFLTGTPKLALRSRAWTWAKVLEEVRHLLPNFVRNDPAVDKESTVKSPARKPMTSPSDLDRAALIIQAVCRHFSCTCSDLESRDSRAPQFAWPRYIAIRLIRSHTGMSVSVIGVLFNRRLPEIFNLSNPLNPGDPRNNELNVIACRVLKPIGAIAA